MPDQGPSPVLWLFSLPACGGACWSELVGIIFLNTKGWSLVSKWLDLALSDLPKSLN